MHQLLFLPALAACAALAAPQAQTTSAAPADPVAIGGAWVALMGDYAGKQIRVWIDGRLADDRRFMFPPLGAVDRLPVELGPPRTVSVRIEIEGCPETWAADVAVAPMKTSGLIFKGCDVTPLRPE